MANQGKTRLVYFITCPPEHVAEGRRIFASHGEWMARTHPRDGEEALIAYNVAIGPERSNPMDASSDPTGNTCFVLTEIYESDAGVSNHFQLAQNTWEEFPALVEWLGKCSMVGTPAAPIVNSLW